MSLGDIPPRQLRALLQEQNNLQSQVATGDSCAGSDDGRRQRWAEREIGKPLGGALAVTSHSFAHSPAVCPRAAHGGKTGHRQLPGVRGPADDPHGTELHGRVQSRVHGEDHRSVRAPGSSFASVGAIANASVILFQAAWIRGEVPLRRVSGSPRFTHCDRLPTSRVVSMLTQFTIV